MTSFILNRDSYISNCIWIEADGIALLVKEKDQRGGPRDVEITAYPKGKIFQVPKPGVPASTWPQSEFSIEAIHALLPEAFPLLAVGLDDALQMIGFTAHERLPIRARMQACLASD